VDAFLKKAYEEYLRSTNEFIGGSVAVFAGLLSLETGK
jgi:hypothetical protein